MVSRIFLNISSLINICCLLTQLHCTVRYIALNLDKYSVVCVKAGGMLRFSSSNNNNNNNNNDDDDDDGDDKIQKK